MRWTANRVIAHNLKRIREGANLTQQQAADLTAPFLPGGGWSRAVWSAAERGVERDRIRQFDGDEIVGLALGLGAPIVSFFLPPAPPEAEPEAIAAAGAERGTTPRDLLELVVAPDEATDERIGVLSSAFAAEYEIVSKALSDARFRNRLRRLLDAVAMANDEGHVIWQQIEDEEEK